jgi:hypothetical protein
MFLRRVSVCQLTDFCVQKLEKGVLRGKIVFSLKRSQWVQKKIIDADLKNVNIRDLSDKILPEKFLNQIKFVLNRLKYYVTKAY